MTAMRRGKKAAKPAEAKLRTVLGGKVNTGVLIDAELWRRFKIRCLQENRREGAILEELITDYLGGKK